MELKRLFRSGMLRPVLKKVARALSVDEASLEELLRENRGDQVFKDGHEEGTLRAPRVVLGAVRGGIIQACNLLIGEIEGGTHSGMNVIIGPVHGGRLHSVNAVIGDVYGGEITDTLLLIGTVYGGHVEVGVHVGLTNGGTVKADLQIDPPGTSETME